MAAAIARGASAWTFWSSTTAGARRADLARRRDASRRRRAATVLGESYRPGLSRRRSVPRQRRRLRAGHAALAHRAGLSCLSQPRPQQARTSRQSVVLATGAQERPVPFPGWTLPGVLTVGAAQILLKSSGQMPDKPVWVAGMRSAAAALSDAALACGRARSRASSTRRHRAAAGRACRICRKAMRAAGDL